MHVFICIYVYIGNDFIVFTDSMDDAYSSYQSSLITMQQNSNIQRNYILREPLTISSSKGPPVSNPGSWEHTLIRHGQDNQFTHHWAADFHGSSLRISVSNKHWSGNIILTQFTSTAAQEVVILIIYGAASDVNVIKMTFLFQWRSAKPQLLL